MFGRLLAAVICAASLSAMGQTASVELSTRYDHCRHRPSECSGRIQP